MSASGQWPSATRGTHDSARSYIALSDFQLSQRSSSMRHICALARRLSISPSGAGPGESFRIEEGLHIARQLLTNINKSGVPAGGELLDVISPQYIGDLISWGAKIGR